MKRKMSPSMKKAWIRFTVLLTTLAILFLSFALFAGVLAPFDPLESHYADMLKAPNSTYIFGTDQLGRDLFSRILYGGKSSSAHRVYRYSDYFFRGNFGRYDRGIHRRYF